MSCDRPFSPFVSPASTSTVADAYRLLNHTVGNRTVVEDGYYYLNNFDNILNSFGECRNPRRGRSLGLLHLAPLVLEEAEQSCLRPLPPQVCATLPPVLSSPEGVCGLPSPGGAGQARSQVHSATRFYSFSDTFSVLGQKDFIFAGRGSARC